jgi:hypothetical protein
MGIDSFSMKISGFDLGKRGGRGVKRVREIRPDIQQIPI